MTYKRPTPETDALIARQDSEYANKATQTMDYKHRKQLIAHARAMEAQRDQHAKERYWARADANAAAQGGHESVEWVDIPWSRLEALKPNASSWG